MKRLHLTLFIVAALAYFTIPAASRREWRKVLASPNIPSTSFSCYGRPIGYYADVEADCQVYHMCGDGERQYSYLCPNTTLFHQRMLICAHWYQVNCSRSPDYYKANLLIGQRNKPFLEENLDSGKQLYSLEDVDDLQKLNPTRGDRGSRRIEHKKEAVEEKEKGTRKRGGERRSSDLEPAPSGSVIPRGQERANSYNSPRSEYRGFKHSLNFARTPSSTETTVTEPVTIQFRPTNISFRSTIETPYSEPTITQTLPMTIRDVLRTESVFSGDRAVTESAETLLALPPSLELQPPLDQTQDTNTIELHLEDPRRSFYIPESAGVVIPRKEIVVSIPVKGASSVFKPTYFRKDSHRECKRCHPMFIIDKKNCSPCLLVS